MSKKAKTTPDPRAEYDALLKSVPVVQRRVREGNQQLQMIEGALQTLEKLHGFNREAIITELNGSSV